MKNSKGGFGRRNRFVAGLLTGSILAMSASPALAQDASQDPASDDDDTIIITGIRSALQSALNEERNADSLIEVIQAEDIGKLPDQNLAEVLENIPGVQITRRAGVGSGVQIRGTNDNRTEINGVSTVGSGTGRGGINFEDVNAAIIASLEVIKAPEARTIEGSVGGTINLRTIRPLDIVDRVASVRVQGEYSEFSDTFSPRVAASFGDNWETGIGDIGIVIAGSYTEQEALSLRPRVDRDGGLVENVNASVIRNGGTPEDQATRRPAAQSFDFLGIQFLNQELENFKYETINFAGSLEWAPSDNLTFFFDGFYNDQQRRQNSSRIQGSGVSSVLNFNVPATFETIDYGTLDGVNLGSIQAALTGVIEPNLAADDDDPNLRFSSDTGARLTESQLYRLGFDWDFGRVSVRVEAATSKAETRNPNLSTTLNFINPNAPLDGGGGNDNAVPFAYDLSDGLTFGINFASPFAPSVADLLNPANVVLDAITIGADETENSEDSFRVDLSYDTFDVLPFVESLDFGFRYNNRNSRFQDIGATLGLSALSDSPRGTAFSELLVPGPDFAGDFDGRELAFRNFLLIDPDRSFNDPEGTLTILRAALAGVPGMRTIGDATPNDSGFFDIDEETAALYGQANFDFGPLRGNVGLRYVATNIDSTGNNIANGIATQVTTTGGYQEWLPRVNLVMEPVEDVVLRASYTEDINRPDFNSLSTSIVFGTSAQAAIPIGNPNLAPETVASYDASVDWYFAPSALLSVGVFHKVRDNLFVQQLNEAPEDGNGFKDITAPCEAGGIFNPIADRNVSASAANQGNGICVDILTTINDAASTTQTGVEVAFQYDLSGFEDTLGFASGFGVIANYTYQEFGGGEAFNTSAGRGTDIFNAINGIYNDANFVEVTAVQGLLDFSPHAYNVTLFYEKYGLSARARYTWRDAFRTLDTAGGASLNSTLGFPVVTEARGQLNASIVYEVTDFFSLGVEGVNLTKSDITQSCVNEGAQFCFQGLPDRRLTFGATISF